MAAKARGHKTNCLLLDSFLQDIMRTLDNQGRALADADSLQLAHLLELIEAAIELVDSCNKPGLYDMCLLPFPEVEMPSALQFAHLASVVSCSLSVQCCKPISYVAIMFKLHLASNIVCKQTSGIKGFTACAEYAVYMSNFAGRRLVAANGWSKQVF